MDILKLLLNYSYPVGLTVVFLLIYLSVRFKMKGAEKRKLKSIRKRKITEPVDTEAPTENQEETLRHHGITGIENRFSFMGKALPFLLITLWSFLAILPYLEKVPSAYVSIIAGVFSVVVGFALRPFLENVFSGVIISFFKSIRIGDTVIIDGHYGLIEEIGLAYTNIKRWDWHRIVIPNSKLLQKEIQNLTLNDQYIWAHVEFYVSPDEDLKKVAEIAKTVPLQSKYYYKSEAPSFWVMDIQKDSIKCWVAAWADSPSNAWELRNEIRTNILLRFQEEKIQLHRINLSSLPS